MDPTFVSIDKQNQMSATALLRTRLREDIVPFLYALLLCLFFFAILCVNKVKMRYYGNKRSQYSQ